MITLHHAIVVLALLLSSLAVQAQGFYYHSTMPDGRVVIGDEPAPGAKAVKKVPLVKGNVSAPLSTPAPPGAVPSEQALDGSETAIRQAQAHLEAAKTALEAGREPLPGERSGTASGASRLNDAYSTRIKALEDEVSAAQKRLDDAYSRRNAERR